MKEPQGEQCFSPDLLLDHRFRLGSHGLSRPGPADSATPVALDRDALDLLRLLAERPGKLVGNDEIAKRLGTSDLAMRIATLRRVLDRDRTGGSCIQTMPGRGYRFVGAVSGADRGVRAGARTNQSTPMEKGRVDRFEVLGVRVSAADTAIAMAEIDRWIRQGYRAYVTLTGVHGIMESVRNEEIRRVHNMAGLVLPDGMPLVWMLRHGGFKFAGCVRGSDLMSALFEHSQRTGYRHFLYGAMPRTLGLLNDNFGRRFPAAEIVGTHAPPLRPAGADEEEAVIDAINASGAQIIWVGLSTPKQELWMARHRHRLSAPVLIGVGAAFDFHAGIVRQAPRWLHGTGLEWVYRMAMEPRRLGKRYLRNNPAFLLLVAAERLGVARVGERKEK
jgi:N-acetylglucosaminyldiphosphoundecaprenol N-acetyl-beta-D-mannosaminyltransferase